jgi:FolB domain-containing protein
MVEPCDSIHIHELALDVCVGVPDEERANPQRLTVSITLWPSRGFSQVADDLNKTVNYSAVAREVHDFVAGRADQLIETLADAIASHLLRTFHLPRVRIELHKFVLPDAKFVAAICERHA